MSKNSHFEVCSTVPSDVNGSQAGISDQLSDFGKDIVSEAGSDSGGISSHDSSKKDTDRDYNTEPSIKSGWGEFLNIYFCYLRERNNVQ